MKKAAIYIRVSTERQADKVSPQTQEEDCREYCKVHNYQVIEVYRDTEKYRSGKKMVEPSGTRSDRPQFLRALADVDNGKIDILIAWREDRLYRGVNRAMLEIGERVKEGRLTVELAKEHYDPNIAAVKAWAAGFELQAKHDRFFMGVAGRLQKGKDWLPLMPFGYRKTESGDIVINENEAQWVRKIWEWYGAGVSVVEIRRRLIEGNAPQRKGGKYVWSTPNIRS
jgi:site-specific DNA recombinase